MRNSYKETHGMLRTPRAFRIAGYRFGTVSVISSDSRSTEHSGPVKFLQVGHILKPESCRDRKTAVSSKLVGTGGLIAPFSKYDSSPTSKMVL